MQRSPGGIRCAGILEREGWRLKLYEIAGPRAGLLEAAARLVYRLPQPPCAEDRYGVGFLCVHAGDEASHAFIDWWSRSGLHHLTYSAPPGDPGALEPVAPGAPAVCVRDIEIIAFERRAWLDALRPGGEPLLDRYLRACLDGPR